MNVVDPQKQAVRVCATCGQPLTYAGPDGECVRCLVSFGFLAEDHEVDRGSERNQVRLGPLRYAHFEVEVNSDGYPVILGSGAMAVTYRARDTVLNSTVALKVISRKLAEDPTARARFLREARAAAQIHHPNIARVTHYGEQDGECFYAMELVHGETLEQRVQREGPLPLSLALEVVEQTARGLAAGEEGGVIHRDLKPSNLMIESHAGDQLLVKIIDYGVAKVIAAQNPTFRTQAGFIGTPAFASPEQFDEAGQQQIDSRSDVYALGVTFWYLLTGRTPFAGRSIEEVRTKQAEQLPLKQLKSAHIPLECIALLKSVLALDPAKRPQTARELLTKIHRCHIRFEPAARRRRKRLVLGSVGTALALALLLLANFLYQRIHSSSELDRSIAVLPFENSSPDGEDAFFTVGMQDEITSAFARLAGMKVIGSQSTRAYLSGKNRNYGAIARELGVRHLLEGAVSRSNGQMRVSLRLVDPDGTRPPWTHTYERPSKDVFALQSEITRAVADQLQTRISPQETTTMDAPPTNDLRAYDLYLEARALATNNPEEVGQVFSDGKRAIALLKEAIARDPNFVLAYCELAKWHDTLDYGRQVGPPEERLIDHRALAEAALEKARRLQPDAGAVHLQLALHALFNRNPDEAEIQVQLARPSLPNNPELEALAGRVARRQDRWDEAVRCFERAVSLQPRDVSLRVVLTDTYRFMRRYSDYDRGMGAVIAMLPPDKRGIFHLNRAAGRIESSADVAPYQAAFAAEETAHQLDDDDRATALMIAALYTRDAAAISRFLSFKHNVGYNAVTFHPEWFEALIARMRGQDEAAMAAFAAARPDIEKQVIAQPTEGMALSLLAIVDAGLGRNEQAVEEAKRACELNSYKRFNIQAPTVRCNLAVVYAWTGQNDLAIAELTKLIDRPAGEGAIYQPTYGDLRLNFFWDPLRNDPRFEALVRRLAATDTR